MTLTETRPQWPPPPPEDRQRPAAEWRVPEEAPKPKKSHGLRWVLIGAAVGVLLIGGIVAGILVTSGGGAKTVHVSTPAVTTPAPITPPSYVPPTTTPPITTPPPVIHNPVTNANYDAIQFGMTLAQVEQIMGGPADSHRAGAPIGSSATTSSVETYTWNGPNGSYMEVGLSSGGTVATVHGHGLQ